MSKKGKSILGIIQKMPKMGKKPIRVKILAYNREDKENLVKAVLRLTTLERERTGKEIICIKHMHEAKTKVEADWTYVQSHEPEGNIGV